MNCDFRLAAAYLCFDKAGKLRPSHHTQGLRRTQHSAPIAIEIANYIEAECA